MADEALVQSRLSIRVGELSYLSPFAKAMRLDVSVLRGPTPGQLVVPTTGRLVYFNELTEPGLCEIANLDEENYVEVGVYDTITGRFTPLLEVGPGECWPLKLSRNLKEQYTGSGTGTTGAVSYLMIKANGASCDVYIGAFEQ